MPVTETASIKESSYLKYLPAIYRDDVLMGQLLNMFESILSPIEHSVDNIAFYFDPLTTPTDFLAWLGLWMGLALDPAWPEERRRELVKSIPELYRWRGTRRGMVKYIVIYTGREPEIYEYMPGIALGSDVKMGSDARLGSGAEWNHFNIVLSIDKRSKIQESKVRAIIEAQKPAHSAYTLTIRALNGE